MRNNLFMKLISRIVFACGLLVALSLFTVSHYALAMVWFAVSVLAISAPSLGLGVNALGTLQGELILRRALELVFTKRPLLKNISMGFRDIDSGAVEANFMQVVKTRIKAVATVGNFGDPPTARADVDVAVTLNQHRQVYHQFTVAEVNSTDRDLVAESAEPLAVAVGNDIIDAIATLWKPSNYTGGKPPGDPNAPGTADGKTTVGAAWSYTNTLIPMRNALAKRGVPDWGWFAVLNSDVYGSLLADSLIVSNLNNVNQGGAIMTGALPQVSNMVLMEYPALPANAANMIGFAGSPESTVYVARVPKDPREVLPGAPFPGVMDVITEPRTGFSVLVTQWIDPTTLAVNSRLSWMAGYGVGNPICGQCLVSA
jgi:hypothetical protein